jgi:lysosomal acid lipase/cholesteryl ester hydrolase
MPEMPDPIIQTSVSGVSEPLLPSSASGLASGADFSQNEFVGFLTGKDAGPLVGRFLNNSSDRVSLSSGTGSGMVIWKEAMSVRFQFDIIMPRIPIVGRLFLREYSVLFVSFVIIVIEAFVRYSTILLPQSVTDWFYNHSKTVFDTFVRSPRPKTQETKWAEQIRTSSSFEDLCNMYGYTVESHIVQTKDGYLLGLHRLPARRHQRRAKPGTSAKKKVVYLHHGLLMNSEVWVCITDYERILPFALVEQGYDVWFGNNRGNKYSKKAIHCTPNQTRFWNYSLDEFCMHDIPDSIEYVLSVTGEKSLSYIGFSQGTAQAFAALSIHPQLNQKVNLLIALAPAISPPGLFQPIVDGLMKATPTLVFLFFGRKAILSSAVMWQSIIYNPIWNWTIDAGLKFLFNWHCRNISNSQKVAAYSHLYSFTSVKAVVHWFQIMRRGQPS